MFTEQSDPSFWTKTACLQLWYGIWANLTIVSVGLAFGWPAVAIPQLIADTSISLTTSEESWIASVITLCAPVGCLTGGYLMDTFGRKYVLLIAEIPMCLGWLYIGCANSATHIIVGRTICGIGIGFAMTAPRTYLTEITLPNMRGVVGAIPGFAVALGITLQAALGSYVKWDYLCFISASYTGVLVCLFYFIPETPYFVLMNGTLSETRQSLKKFRSDDYNIDQELDELEDFKTSNEIRRLSFEYKMREIFKPSSCKPFGISILYLLIMQLVGINVVIMWGVEMFEMCKSSVDANLAHFILGLTRMGVSLLTSFLLYKVTRRLMALLSAVGVGVTCLSLCFFLKMYDDFSIYPLLFFISYVSFGTLGYQTLPFLIMFEILPLQVRGIMGSIAMSILHLMMFAVNKWYPLLRNAVGLPYTICTFGICSLLGAIILYFILPETKGLTLQEIEEYFNSTRPTLVSQRRVKSSQLLRTASSSPLANNSKSKQSKTSKVRFKAIKEGSSLKLDKNEGTEDDEDKSKKEKKLEIKDE